MENYLKQIIIASIIAGLFSGIPSITYFILTGQNLLEPFQSIGLIFLDSSYSNFVIFLLSAGLHLFVSLFWSIVLKFIMPNKKQIIIGMTAGIVIAFIDIIIIGTNIPAIANLEFFPQLADHILWGFIVSTIYSRKYFIKL